MDGGGQGGRADGCYGVKEDLSGTIGGGRIVRGLDGRFGMRGGVWVCLRLAGFNVISLGYLDAFGCCGGRKLCWWLSFFVVYGL